jgi:hypothetical protein
MTGSHGTLFVPWVCESEPRPGGSGQRMKNKLSRTVRDDLHFEEREMMSSPTYRKSIVEARRQIKQGNCYYLDLKTGKFRKIRKP